MKTIGLYASDHLSAALTEGQRIVGPIHRFPDGVADSDYLAGFPAEEILKLLLKLAETARAGSPIDAVGVGFPGVIVDGVFEDSPELPQMKGLNLAVALGYLVGRKTDRETPVVVVDDADALAAGLAARYDQLEKIVRVWTLGESVGFGRYPQVDRAGEGGHSVVTLDPKERFCHCGGLGHLDGIVGHRSMRLRFLDLEPEEIFDASNAQDPRLAVFVKYWHRALAAATANSIHMEGPGRFFLSGANSKFVRKELLQIYLAEMVKMSPLGGSSLEIVSASDELGVIGAALAANSPSLTPELACT